jgi:glycosyltransferase involved in cell wall biosynthesis
LTRVLHIISGLEIGGAEMMLLKLLTASRSSWDSVVVSLKDEGRIGSAIRQLGVPLECLGLRTFSPDPRLFLSLRRTVKKFRPQIIQGWMPHGNFASSIAQVASRVPAAVIWNVRMTLDDVDGEKATTMGLIRLGAFFSRHPDAIIYNSQSGAEQHEKIGYRSAVRAVISNGFDCDIFRPDEPARCEIRKELDVRSGEVLIGLVARYHPMKDHAGFLEAASLVSAKHPESRFLLIGKSLGDGNSTIRDLIEKMGLARRVILLGERTDTPQLTAALDIACSSSAWGEGFSNSVGEAMACGVPCVVTRVGDSAFLVGETGMSVPPRSPEAFATAIAQLIYAGSAKRKELGLAARNRIESEFSLPKIALRYDDLYQKCSKNLQPVLASA